MSIENLRDETTEIAVQRSSLREQIRNWILQRIGRGELAPGDRVVETKVARELQVSPIPVREAIRELTAMRVLDSEPNKGARVRRVRLDETIEALQVRAAIEPLAISLAVSNLKGRSKELRGIVKRLIATARKRDFAAYQRANQEFHRGIAEASGNSVLLRTWDALAYEVGARSIMDMLDEVDPVAVAREHELVLDALDAGEPRRAAELLAGHTRHLIEQLRTEMANGKNPDGGREGIP